MAEEYDLDLEEDAEPAAETEAPEAETPELAAEDIELLTAGSRAVLDVLNDDAELMADVERVVAEKLKDPITPSTLGEIAVALEVLVGAQAAEYLVRVAMRYDNPAYLEQVRTYGDPEVWRAMRRLVALYGQGLYEAFAQAGEPLDTWRGLTRFAYYDAVSGLWKLTVEITTYGGDKIRLSEAPESMLRLVLGLVQTLNAVQADMAGGLVPESDVQEFFSQCLTLVSVYAPSLAGEAEAEE